MDVGGPIPASFQHLYILKDDVFRAAVIHPFCRILPGIGPYCLQAVRQGQKQGMQDFWLRHSMDEQHLELTCEKHQFLVWIVMFACAFRYVCRQLVLPRCRGRSVWTSCPNINAEMSLLRILFSDKLNMFPLKAWVLWSEISQASEQTPYYIVELISFACYG